MKYFTCILLVLLGISSGTGLSARAALRQTALAATSAPEKEEEPEPGDDSASAFETGIDIAADLVDSMDSEPNWQNLVRGIALTSIKMIPEVGPLLSAIIGLFWPGHKESIWDQVEPMVQKLIVRDLTEEALLEMKASVFNLKEQLFQYKRAQEQFQEVALKSTPGAPDVISSKVAAQAALYRAIDHLQGIQLDIHEMPAQERLAFIVLFGGLAQVHLLALRTAFNDFEGDTGNLLLLGPWYSDAIEESMASLESLMYEKSTCGNINYWMIEGGKSQNYYYGCSYPTMSNYFVITCSETTNPSVGLPYTTCQDQDGTVLSTPPDSTFDSMWNYQPVSKGAYTKAKRAAIIKQVTKIRNYMPTRDELVSLSSTVMKTPFNQFMDSVSKQCLAIDFHNPQGPVHFEPCDSSASQANQQFGMDIFGAVRTAVDISLCLTVNVSQPSMNPYFSECLGRSFTEQIWTLTSKQTLVNKLTNTYLSQPSSAGNGNLMLVSSSASAMSIVMNTGSSAAFQMRDCGAEAVDFTGNQTMENKYSLMESTPYFQAYVNKNNVNLQPFCQQRYSSLSCPSQKAAWGLCLTPTWVANENEDFTAVAGKMYMMVSNVDFDIKTSPLNLTAGKVYGCKTSHFGGHDIAPGKTKSCWEIGLVEGADKDGHTRFCHGAFYPNPEAGSTEQICTTKPLVNPHMPSKPVCSEKEWFTPKKTGILYFAASNGKLVATRVGINQLNKAIQCTRWNFWDQDPDSGQTKKCFFIEDFDDPNCLNRLPDFIHKRNQCLKGTNYRYDATFPVAELVDCSALFRPYLYNQNAQLMEMCQWTADDGIKNSCPNQRKAWSICVLPTLVAAHGGQFIAQPGKSYFMATEDLGRKSSVRTFTDGSTVSCNYATGNFQDPDKGSDTYCFEFTTSSSGDHVANACLNLGLYPYSSYNSCADPSNIGNPPGPPVFAANHGESYTPTKTGRMMKQQVIYVSGNLEYDYQVVVIGSNMLRKPFPCTSRYFGGATGKGACFFLADW